MELKRDEIIKVLEYCSLGGNCIYCRQDLENPRLSKEGCMAVQMRNALSLIKELTEENERLSGCVKSKEEVEVITRATYEPLVKEIVKEQIDKATADTVRKMQERFVMHFGTYTVKDVVNVLDVLRLVNQIAEEILEEGK